jgi:hypothetical protein
MVRPTTILLLSPTFPADPVTSVSGLHHLAGQGTYGDRHGFDMLQQPSVGLLEW